jgi:hypothetical protein
MGENTANLTGVAAHFSELFPRLGILAGSIETAGYGRSIKLGDNFLELRGAPWLGYRWTLTGGDFRFAPSVVEFPVTNLYYPDLSLRGVKIEAASGATRYAVFWGRQTLLEGPRVPFRQVLPQSVFGASARREFGRFAAGIRLLQFAADPTAGDEFLFPAGRRFRSASVASAQVSYTLFANLKLFGELTASRADLGRSAPFSQTAGAAWESTRVTIHLNWVRQSKLYYPAAGYFAGDRAGPFGELRLRPWRRVEMFGSASRYRSNLERDASLPEYRSKAASAGVSARLPLALTSSVQFSKVSFSSRNTASEEPIESSNRQWIATVSRSFRRHTVRLTERRMDLILAGRPEKQRTSEAEEAVQWGRLYAAGAMRLQRTSGTERRNTLYYRGSLQTRFGRVSASAHAEIGNDMVNRTLFATSSYTTTFAAVSVRLSHEWSAEFEAFRNSSTMDLNPESIFVLSGGGVGVSGALSAMNQWTAFFRIRKQFGWGGPLPSGTPDATLGRFVPLVGAVEGVVFEVTAAGRGGPIEGVPVVLDGSRPAETNATGHFRFEDVPEGTHTVALAARSLPAELDPGPAREARIVVKPRATARADLEVERLTAVSGKVSGAKGVPVENILVRLVPTGRYTSTDAEGRFAFHNLRAGNYDATLDASSFAPDVLVAGPGTLPVQVRLDQEAPPLEFHVELHKKEKPVRHIELN